MKKLLPIIIFLFGAAVLIGVFLFVKNKKNAGNTLTDDGEVLVNIPLEERPVVSLAPTDDGHWLNLRIEKIVIDAASMDYELLYKLEDGGTQGVPGTIKLEGDLVITRKLLLGSESSGKFRYDEGVEEGTLTLRFRNEKGKMVAKFSTDLHLQTGAGKLTSMDGKFSYKLDDDTAGYFVTMETFGIPDNPPGNITTKIYGVFASEGGKLPGSVKIDGADTIYRWADDRFTLETLNKGNNVESVGIFAGIDNIAED